MQEDVQNKVRDLICELYEEYSPIDVLYFYSWGNAEIQLEKPLNEEISKTVAIIINEVSY